MRLRGIGLVLVLVIGMVTTSLAAPGVHLTIKLNKTDYKVGDDFLVDIFIQNSGSRAIRVLLWKACSSAWIQLTDEQGKPILSRVLLPVAKRNASPDKDSYQVLSPHQSFIVSLKGKVVNNSEIAPGEGVLPDSVAIRFPDSDIPLPQAGTYFLQAKFKQNAAVTKEAAEQYGFSDMWQGGVISDKTKLLVSK